MIVDLIGVLQTGKRRAAGVPSDTRRPLRLVAGSDDIVRMRLVEPDGASVALDFPDGDALTMTARRTSSSGIWFGVAFGPDVDRGRGWYRAAIPGGLTKNLGGQRGTFDVWAKRTDVGAEPVVELSQLTIEPRDFSGQITAAAPPGAGASIKVARAFRWSVPAPGGVGPYTVAIADPAGNMPSGHYAIVYSYADVVHPDTTLRFSTELNGSTSSQFVVTPDGALVTGTLVNFYLVDLG